MFKGYISYNGRKGALQNKCYDFHTKSCFKHVKRGKSFLIFLKLKNTRYFN